MLIRIAGGNSAVARVDRLHKAAATAAQPHRILGSPKNAVFTSSRDETGALKRVTGPGLTEPIGKNAGRMVEILTDPKFLRKALGDAPFEHMAARRKELEQVGAKGRYTGALGMSQGGDLQYVGSMDARQLYALMWTDPTIFEDEKRLERLIRQSELAVKL